MVAASLMIVSEPLPPSGHSSAVILSQTLCRSAAKMSTGGSGLARQVPLATDGGHGDLAMGLEVAEEGLGQSLFALADALAGGEHRVVVSTKGEEGARCHGVASRVVEGASLETAPAATRASAIRA